MAGLVPSSPVPTPLPSSRPARPSTATAFGGPQPSRATGTAFAKVAKIGGPQPSRARWIQYVLLRLLLKLLLVNTWLLKDLLVQKLMRLFYQLVRFCSQV